MVAEWGMELKCAIGAIKKAGGLLSNSFERQLPIIRKSKNEFVTKIDIESQSVIVESLKKDFPAYECYTEEVRSNKDIEGLTWVIDPLDGTHNYISGLDNVGISIGLVSQDAFHLGVIYLPIKGLLLYAVKGQGAYCNDVKIEVGRNADLSKSMVTYDNQFHLDEKTFKNYERLIPSVFTTRIFGVATYDIALVAMGKIDARVWNST